MSYPETFERALIRFFASPSVAVLDLDRVSPSTVIVFLAEANFEGGDESLASSRVSSLTSS